MISPTDLFDSLEKVSLSDFGNEFSIFTQSAIRLETLTAYDVTFEIEDFSAFKNGQPAPRTDFNCEWHQSLKEAQNRGARVSRRRVVPRIATDYLRFEILWGYQPSSQFGEEYLFSYSDEFEKEFGNDLVRLDFWVFDYLRIYVMFYDTDGKFLGAERGNSSTLIWGNDTIKRFPGTRDLSWALTNYAIHS